MTIDEKQVDSILVILLNGQKIEDYNKIIPTFESRIKTMIVKEIEHSIKMGKPPSDMDIAMTVSKAFRTVVEW